jgi:hypothetical protein
MLFLDEYYRTLVGFIVLIEKEWISFGHKFADRSGCKDGSLDGWKDEERSPVFQLFLDCVHQCIVQQPHSFEFNQSLLLFLMEYSSCGWFVNFAFNSEKELKSHLSNSRWDTTQPPLVSIWSIVLANMDTFTNKSFVPSSTNSSVLPIDIIITRNRLVVWSDWFLRWNDRLWGASWLDGVNQQLGVLNHKKRGNNHANNVKPRSQSNFMTVFWYFINGGFVRNHNLLINETIAKWVDDNSVHSCTKCHRIFSFLFRKHHCRACGQIFCETCTKELRIIPMISTWKPCRCCTDCAMQLDGEDESIDNGSRHTLSKNNQEGEEVD